MGLYRWRCPECGAKTQALLQDRPLGNPTCPDCPPLGKNEHQLMEPVTDNSLSVMEVRDNGLMPRKLERYRDVEELRKSHADAAKPKDDGIV